MTHPDMTFDLGPLECEPVNHRPPFAVRVAQDLYRAGVSALTPGSRPGGRASSPTGSPP